MLRAWRFTGKTHSRAGSTGVVRTEWSQTHTSVSLHLQATRGHFLFSLIKLFPFNTLEQRCEWRCSRKCPSRWPAGPSLQSLPTWCGSAHFPWLPVCPTHGRVLAPGRARCDPLAPASSQGGWFSQGNPLRVSHLVVRRDLAAILELALDEICAL